MSLIKKQSLKNQFSFQDEKMKSLEKKKLVKSKAKLENLSNTKLVVDNRFVSIFFLLSLKLTKFIFFLLIGIIKKRLILLG